MKTLTFQVKEQVESAMKAMKEAKDGAIMDTIIYAQTPISAGGHMPVRTGYLRSTGQAAIGITSFPTTFNLNKSGVFNWTAAATKATIESSRIGDPITWGWSANYAPYANYGANGHPGHMFNDLAAQAWPHFVELRGGQAKAKYKL